MQPSTTLDNNKNNGKYEGGGRGGKGKKTEVVDRDVSLGKAWKIPPLTTLNNENNK